MIRTPRLVLRPWRDADIDPYVAVTNTAEVMEYLGGVSDVEALEAGIARQQALQDRLGYCFWVVERRDDGALMGFCGIKPGPADTPIAADTEIGWRFGRAFWGQGYAQEAAQASLDHAWRHPEIARVAAITAAINRRSRGLMERLGMAHFPDEDFDHPGVAQGSAIRRHVVYRIARPA